LTTTGMIKKLAQQSRFIAKEYLVAAID